LAELLQELGCPMEASDVMIRQGDILTSKHI